MTEERDRLAIPHPKIPADKDTVCRAFDAFVNQRPGMTHYNYVGDISGWYRDRSQVTRDRARAIRALNAFMPLPYQPEIFDRALSSVSSLRFRGDRLDYITRQYFAVEYRKAAATVLERYAEMMVEMTVRFSADEANRSAPHTDLSDLRFRAGFRSGTPTFSTSVPSAMVDISSSVLPHHWVLPLFRPPNVVLTGLLILSRET